MTDTKQTIIETIAGGAVAERIEEAIEECAANILDPNTEWKVKRSVTIKIDLASDADREMVTTQVSVKASLAPPKAIPAKLVIGGSERQAIVAEYVSPQLEIELPKGVDSIEEKREAR